MSVQQKGSSYYPVLWIRDPKTGKGRYQWYDAFPSKKAAEREERRLRTEQANGSPVERSKETVEQFLRRWLAVKKSSLAPKTYQGYEDIILNRWIPAMGGVRMKAFVSDTKYILEAQSDWLNNGVT